MRDVSHACRLLSWPGGVTCAAPDSTDLPVLGSCRGSALHGAGHCRMWP